MESLKNKVKSTISADRNRYKVQLQARHYDLDLTYITPNILAMAIPGKGFESFWRNHIDDVGELLKAKHTTSFLIWNLSERSYDYSKFDDHIVDFPFPDHHPPPLNIFPEIINSIDSWLRAEPSHVAVVHCKGGKGRTGTVIVAYLLYSKLYDDLQSAENQFANRRSDKGKGVTQPSQRRYLSYFSEIICNRKILESDTLTLTNIILFNPPKCSNEKDFILMEFMDYTTPQNPKTLLQIKFDCYGKSERFEKFVTCQVKDDILIRFYLPRQSKKPIFHLVLNTNFIKNEITFKRSELDSVDKKIISEDFSLSLRFQLYEKGKPEPPSSPWNTLAFRYHRTKLPDTFKKKHFNVQRASYIFFDSPLTSGSVLVPNQKLCISKSNETKKKTYKKKGTEFDLNMSCLINAQRSLTNCPEGFNLSSTIGFQRKMIQQGTISRKTSKNKFSPIRVILTNDLLVLAKIQPLSNTFSFRNCYNLKSLKIFDLPDNPKNNQFTFKLISISHLTPDRLISTTLGSSNKSEKSLWYNLIKQQIEEFENFDTKQTKISNPNQLLSSLQNQKSFENFQNEIVLSSEQSEFQLDDSISTPSGFFIQMDLNRHIGDYSWSDESEEDESYFETNDNNSAYENLDEINQRNNNQSQNQQSKPQNNIIDLPSTRSSPHLNQRIIKENANVKNGNNENLKIEPSKEGPNSAFIEFTQKNQIRKINENSINPKSLSLNHPKINALKSSHSNLSSPDLRSHHMISNQLNSSPKSTIPTSATQNYKKFEYSPSVLNKQKRYGQIMQEKSIHEQLTQLVEEQIIEGQTQNQQVSSSPPNNNYRPKSNSQGCYEDRSIQYQRMIPLPQSKGSKSNDNSPFLSTSRNLINRERSFTSPLLRKKPQPPPKPKEMCLKTVFEKKI